MKEYLEQLVIGVLAGIISYYALPHIPDVPTDIDFLQYANQPAVRFVIFLGVVWYFLSLIMGEIRRRRRIKRRSPSFSVVKRTPEIRYPRWSGVVRKFGVDWEGEYGSPGIGDDPIGVAEGPYCPECGTELMSDKKERRIRSDKPIWKCPGCTSRTTRPKDFLHEEKEAVGRWIEREMEVDANRFDDLAPDESEDKGRHS